MSADLIKALLNSPVLVALIPAVVARIGGRYLLQAKDECIAAIKDAHAAELRARDVEIAALERSTPARMRKHAEAMREFFDCEQSYVNEWQHRPSTTTPYNGVAGRTR